MANETLVPQIRFPEFSGNWKSKEFGNLYDFKTTNSYSRDNLNYENGSVKNIHYGDIHTKFNSQFDIKRELVPYINEDIDISRISDENYLVEGDLIIADASEDYADIGKSIEIINLNDEKTLAGLHTILARRKSEDIAIGFASFIMKTNIIRLAVMRMAQGSKVLSISAGRLAKIKLPLPEPDEQTKIADFITNVDTQIQLLEKEKTLLEKYKKGISQKIFNQEIRFKDENGNDFPDWEEKILRDICHKKSSNISANTLDNNSGIYKVYGANGLFQTVNFFEENVEYISIVKDGAGIGRIMLCEAKSSVLGTMDIIKPNENVDIGFLFSVLLNINFKKYGIGSTIPHIYFKDYCKEKINIPSKPEQQKISVFINSIESSIQKTESQIFKLKDFKNGLLQKMFV